MGGATVTARRIELDERCQCGRRKHAVMAPAFAFGREGGSWAITERGCDCGRMDDVSEQP